MWSIPQTTHCWRGDVTPTAGLPGACLDHTQGGYCLLIPSKLHWPSWELGTQGRVASTWVGQREKCPKLEHLLGTPKTAKPNCTHRFLLPATFAPNEPSRSVTVEIVMKTHSDTRVYQSFFFCKNVLINKKRSFAQIFTKTVGGITKVAWRKMLFLFR